MNRSDLRELRLRTDVIQFLDETARKRIDRQREGFKRLGDAIARVPGFRKVAAEFRLEADRAIARAEEFEVERIALNAERESLAEVRAVLDAVLPDATRDGRRLTDAERVDWIIQQWKTVSAALGTTDGVEASRDA